MLFRISGSFAEKIANAFTLFLKACTLVHAVIRYSFTAEGRIRTVVSNVRFMVNKLSLEKFLFPPRPPTLREIDCTTGGESPSIGQASNMV